MKKTKEQRKRSQAAKKANQTRRLHKALKEMSSESVADQVMVLLGFTHYECYVLSISPAVKANFKRGVYQKVVSQFI